MSLLRYFLPLFFFLYLQQLYSQQGRMLIVGGGAEKNGANSWSTPAYRWAGQGKRVAIIGTSTGTLAPYFKQQCGAAYAREMAIATRDSANSQITYDTLITYDVIFFRGGDQWEYYDLYRNTKLQEAVEYLFSHGGTICGTSAGMHILSSIVYTAENGTVYPYECIQNPNNQYVTLKNDFMDLVPGYIFDTHFAERSRFGRLVGFLANCKLNKGLDIIGLGMDDYTCMTIDTNKIGTVYGTGCANIYRSNGSFSLNGTKLLADSISVVQLLQGCSYNFNNGESNFTTLDRQINTSDQSETGNYTVMASGGNQASVNHQLIIELANAVSLVGKIAVISSGTSVPIGFKSELEALGTGEVHIFDPATIAGNDTSFAHFISGESKFLFVANTPAALQEFIQTDNGKLLYQKIHEDGSVSAFIGADARFAGKTVIDNYLTLYSSWYGELIFSPGLALLPYSVIMPETYYDHDYYENTATAVPYVMVLDTLKYGIWLTEDNYMKFTPVDGRATLTGYGIDPIMVLENQGLLAGFSKQTSSGSTSVSPRMVAGLERATLTLLDTTTPYVMGNVKPSGIESSLQTNQIQINPNPAHDQIIFHSPEIASAWMISSLDGNNILGGILTEKTGNIDISGLIPGMYIFKLTGATGKLFITHKFVKK